MSSHGCVVPDLGQGLRVIRVDLEPVHLQMGQRLGDLDLRTTTHNPQQGTEQEQRQAEQGAAGRT